MTNSLKQSSRPILPTKTKIAILASIIAAAIALPFLGPQTVKASNDRHEDSDQRDNADGLVGTWLVQVSLDPSSVPPGSTLNFTRLESYSPGGVVIASNNGPGSGGPAGQGNWARSGHHQFASTELRLGFNAANAFTGLNKIRSSLTVDGDEFTATIQTDIFLPDGTALPFHPVGTSHGTRVPIEGLN
jgi:hypothetical protein